MDCWLFMKCSEAVRNSCPAYPDNGRRCWKVTGTMCDSGRIQKASLQEKIVFCSRCDFYRKFAERF